MTEDNRIPNFWWCPTHHLYRGGDERPCADAVKLGDVEALRAELNRLSIEVIAATSTLETVEAERDLALWLHAEAQWLLDEEECATDDLQGQINDATTWLAKKGFRVNAQERTAKQNVREAVSQLQARIDAVGGVLGHPWWADFDNPHVQNLLDEVRAALQGDQEASRG